MNTNNVNEEIRDEELELNEIPAESEDTECNAEEQNEMIKDPENPLDDIKTVEELLKTVQDILHVMEEQWMASARELHITDAHMKELDKWNEDHKTKMPDDLTEEEKANWDHWNGIDCITEEEVERIFGPAPHPIYGVQHSQTIDRIKGACSDFLGWLGAMREYRQIHDGYLALLEHEEEKSLDEIRRRIEEEAEPDVKAVLQKSVDMYYDRKFLKFLAEPMSEEDRNHLLKALSDKGKIEYWINRSRDKLGQMKISSKIILEISQFEKRFLDEKYHKNSNLLLLYYLRTCAYCNAADKKDDRRIKTVCMTMALDAFIRKTWTEEKMKTLLDNIIGFEDQFLPYIKEPEADNEITPPIVSSESASDDE